MQLKPLLSSLALCAAVAFSSCSSKETEKLEVKNGISQEVLSQIKQLGFSTQGVQRQGNDYVVENDIRLTPQDLAGAAKRQLLRVGTEEQYRTNNLVTALPRTITVSVAADLPAYYVQALDQVISNYNNLRLQVTFQRVTSGAAISMVKYSSTYYGEALFPTNGNPGNTIWLSPTSIGTNASQSFVATIMAHEIGHAIGFRHTDYFNRSYSCGGSSWSSNEGAGDLGAIHIPGTPTGTDANSWMLACVPSGVIRGFNNNDKIALNYVY